jgi:hypothetical protein
MTDATHAIKIRDYAFEALLPLTINGRGMKSARRAPISTVQPDQLPALGVFILSERELPLGGAKQVTLPRFTDNLELGISWVVMATDELLIDGTLDLFVAQAKTLLLGDPEFLEHFEFVEAVSREYTFSKVGESYIAEIRLRMQVSYSTTYPPLAPYDLALIDIKTKSAAGTAITELQIPVPVAPADPDEEED